MFSRPLILMGLLIAVPFSSRAGEVEKKVVAGFVTSYAQEQLKHQLAEFLNKNPQIAFSSNPAIGTQSIHFLSQALSVYGLLTAKTDRERAWSAAYLILSPEPTTAAALFAAQVIDTLMTMKANRDLARIYEEIAEIQAQTSSVVTKLVIQDYNSQRTFVDEFKRSLEQVILIQDALMIDPLYVGLQGRSNLGSLTEEEIQASLTKIVRLREALFDLDVATLYVRHSVRPEELGLDSRLIENCTQSNQEFDSLREKIDSLKDSFFYFFGSLQAERLREKVRSDLRAHAALLRVYLRCAEISNAASSRRLLGKAPLDSDELSECRNRFKTKGI